MSNKNRKPNNSVVEAKAAMRRGAYADKVEAMRDGRMPPRAATFADRKKVANKKACRGRVSV